MIQELSEADSPQVGDTVRVTITIIRDGLAQEWLDGSGVHVGGWSLDDPRVTVEVLHRATPPLPDEPGTWWIDRNDDVWRVSGEGVVHCVAHRNFADPANHAPFRQLVLK